MARYSDTVLQHFRSPRNLGKIDPADAVGLAGTPGRGRFLALYARLEGERLVQVGFECHGCGPTIAAGSALTELIRGRTLSECRDVTAASLLAALDGLPSDKRHCAGFALRALQDMVQGREAVQ